MRLSSSQLRDFGAHGYVVVHDVIPPAGLSRMSAAIDALIDESALAPDHVGQYFYWLSGLHDEPAAGESIMVDTKTNDGRMAFPGSEATAAAVRAATLSLYHGTPLESLATSLVEPGEVEIAFDQAQIALTSPHFSHRPGRGHVDGCEYTADGTPGTFSFLIGVLMSDQTIENVGNLWVWPGTHRRHAEFCRERGPEALIASGCYPDIEITEATQVLGKAGDVVLAHYLLSHNTGGNYERNDTRRTVYYRMRRVGHSARWREAVSDELLEFPPVRAALD